MLRTLSERFETAPTLHFPESAPLVVCVHGYGGNSGQFASLRRAIAREFPTLAIDYPTFTPTPDQARHLVQVQLDELEMIGRPFALVAHSMGAVLSLDWVHHRPHPHLTHFISIAGPHRGTHMGWVCPSPLRKLMRPRLDEDPPDAPDVPTLVLQPEFDQQVIPARSMELAGSRLTVVPGEAHNSVLWSDALPPLVRDFLRGGR